MAKNEKGYTTVSEVAKNLESESIDESENGESTISSRTLERNFKKILKAFGVSEEEVKDEKGAYAFDRSAAPILSAFLLETTRPDSYLRKAMNSKEEDATIDDVIDFFNQMQKLTEGKMEEKERMGFLIKLDQNTHYSMMAVLYNINSTILALIGNLQSYPYEYQVNVMNELFQNVIQKFALEMQKEIGEFLRNKLELQELMDSIEDPEEDE